jgi:hypothetical protein
MGNIGASEAEEKDGELRRKLIRGIDYLTREQMGALVYLIDSITAHQSLPQGAISNGREYDEVLDPAVGLISGPTDYSSRNEDILSQEIGEHGGWTVKEPTNGDRC